MKHGIVNGDHYLIPDGCEVISTEQLQRLHDWANIVSDLDRSPAGRHQGDVESQDPSGVSQGNPILPVGMHIGYTLSGERIVVPPRERRNDPKAWIVKRRVMPS